MSKKIITGIYKITNKINGKTYIGQSVNIDKRWNRHKNEYNREDLHSYEYPIYRAFRKYGLESFDFEIIEECKIVELNDKERYWIRIYDTFFNGYNQTLGGDSASVVPKEYVIGIFNDLRTTSLNYREIAKRNNVSYDLVAGINHGRYWRLDEQIYPIREYVKPKKKENHCVVCGEIIDRKAKMCRKCWKQDERLIKCDKRPEKKQLEYLILRYPIMQIAKIFSVRDNSVRKWCIKYNLPYKYDDIQNMRNELGITEWHATEVKRNKNVIPGKKVKKCSLDGEYIESFISMGEAARSIKKEGVSDATISAIQTNISRCCKNRIKTAFGYKWEFDE